MGVKLKLLCVNCVNIVRTCCGVTKTNNNFRCKLLVVGAGTGGCSIAWRFSRLLQSNEIIVLEPSQVHYNQPQFTLVAAGVRKFKDTHRPTGAVLPPRVRWLQDHAEHFDPANCVVYTRNGDKVAYDFMVVALGLKNRYDMIPGLQKALDAPLCPVTTIYSARYCQKAWYLMQQFKGGHAVFSRPKQCGKCSGASHCIAYLAHDYWKKQNINDRTSMTFTTGDDVLYGVPKYASALRDIAASRGVAVNYDVELVEVTGKWAVYVDQYGRSMTLPYNFLHVSPVMCPPSCLSCCEELVAGSGFLDVDMYTLQHRRFPNIYGIGDCLCTPNSKTAAAVAQQSPIVYENLTDTMEGEKPTAKYNGYGACPILTSYKTGILAEFLYDKQVCETFPFDQSRERRFLYNLKKDVIPYLYWNRLIKGTWNGPAVLRKIINPTGR